MSGGGSCCGGGGPDPTDASDLSKLRTTRGRRGGSQPFVGTAGGSIRASEVEQLEQKLVLVGNVAVGKSSLVNRYTRGEFLEQYQATIGAAFVPKDVQLANGKTIKLQIWDTAGEEKYRAMTQFYYRKAAGGIVVFGLDDYASFEDVQTWVSDLREVCPHVVITIAGNKSDVEPEDRAVTTEMLADLADELGVAFCECSALDGDGVGGLFQQAAERIFDSPESWST